MKFSIRELLAATFLAVLAMLAWRGSQEARRAETRLARLTTDVATQRTLLRLNNPALHQAVLHTLDEFASLQAMREEAVEHFPVLRARYGTLEPPPPGVLAVRTVPSLQTGRQAAPVTFALWVPEQREVWLKFGVHRGEEGHRSTNDPEDQYPMLSQSPFDHSGPYEVRLPAGRHSVTITHALPVVVTLDDMLLLRATYLGDTTGGTGGSWIAAGTQVNYAADGDLPWLLTCEVSGRANAGDGPYEYSLWLGDRSSGFARFPGP